MPKSPTWPGLDKFKGVVEHSATYKNSTPFAGKKVLVVGAGESSSEITRFDHTDAPYVVITALRDVIQSWGLNYSYPVCS